MARIVVAGYMVRNPRAGNVLAFFHYLLGLSLLGHDITYIEESGDWGPSCYDPETGALSDDPAAGIAVANRLFTQFDLHLPLIYANRETGAISGDAIEPITSIIESADLLLNIGGVCWLPEFEKARRKALIDMDPMFTQAGRFGHALIERHDVCFSYGANIGHPRCRIPSDGAQWHPTRPPVVIDMWSDFERQVPESSPPSRYTTIASLHVPPGEVAHGGFQYGQKDRELARFLKLPTITSAELEIALATTDTGAMLNFRKAGWLVRDAGEVSATMESYMRYIAASKGEFSVAKHAYVASFSGWFSDRSVCYMAAGRPVILQDTGFTEWLPSGEGVLAFSSPEQAAACLASVERNYRRHSEAALELAKKYFSHEVVLPRLLDIARA